MPPRHGITENWAKNLDKKTTLTLGAHQTFTADANIPAAVKALSPDHQLALVSDQRDPGGQSDRGAASRKMDLEHGRIPRLVPQ